MKITSIPLDRLIPSKKNRSIGDVTALRDSLEQLGQLAPVLVIAQDSGSYRIIAGHRRTAAARMLRWASIGAIILDGDKSDLIQAAENMVRLDLSLAEKADTADELLKTNALPEVAKAFGVTSSYALKMARLKRELCPEAWERLENEGRNAKVGQWLPFLTFSHDVQLRKIKETTEKPKGRRNMKRAERILAQMQNIPAKDVRYGVLLWVLNQGPWPEGRFFPQG